MATYIELKQQAEALLAEAEIVRKQEITEVVQSIKAQMKEYGLTVADLGARPQRVSAKSPSPNPPLRPNTVVQMVNCGRAAWAASPSG